MHKYGSSAVSIKSSRLKQVHTKMLLKILMITPVHRKQYIIKLKPIIIVMLSHHHRSISQIPSEIIYTWGHTLYCTWHINNIFWLVLKCTSNTFQFSFTFKSSGPLSIDYVFGINMFLNSTNNYRQKWVLYCNSVGISLVYGGDQHVLCSC